ncbi:MAG: Bax inhibitor-1/YccA family protein [Planctomycetaceae bacterium]|jgi:uncharacterized YccA/Bax inhibitor family protein
MRTSNPAFGENVLREISFADESTTMTVNGMVTKTLMALTALMLTAGLAWIQFEKGGYGAVQAYLWGGLAIGLVTSIATCIKPMWAPYTTPVYALAEGAFLGSLSAIISAQYPKVNIVFQACCLTFGTLFVMLIIYQTGVIRVTDRLRAGITAATGAIFLLYLVSFVLGFFGVSIPFIHGSGWLGIAFSLFVVGLAAFNLLLDFDMVDRLVAQRAPKAMEWFAAFALMVTLVWLYLEILRLLSKLQSRR